MDEICPNIPLRLLLFNEKCDVISDKKLIHSTVRACNLSDYFQHSVKRKRNKHHVYALKNSF